MATVVRLFVHELRSIVLEGHCVNTGRANSELLALALGRFEVFVTADRNLSFRQDPSAFDIAIVVLVECGNILEDLRSLMPRLLEVLPTGARHAVTLVQR